MLITPFWYTISSPSFLKRIMYYQLSSFCKTLVQISNKFIRTRTKGRIQIQKQGISLQLEHFSKKCMYRDESLIGTNLKLGLFHNGSGSDRNKMNLDFFYWSIFRFRRRHDWWIPQEARNSFKMFCQLIRVFRVVGLVSPLNVEMLFVSWGTFLCPPIVEFTVYLLRHNIHK